MTIISIIIIVTISPERVALIAVMPYYLRVLMAVFGARIILNLREVAVRGERGGLGMSTVAVQAEGQGGEGDGDGDVGRTFLQSGYGSRPKAKTPNLKERQAIESPLQHPESR